MNTISIVGIGLIIIVGFLVLSTQLNRRERSKDHGDQANSLPRQNPVYASQASNVPEQDTEDDDQETPSSDDEDDERPVDEDCYRMGDSTSRDCCGRGQGPFYG